MITQVQHLSDACSTAEEGVMPVQEQEVDPPCLHSSPREPSSCPPADTSLCHGLYHALLHPFSPAHAQLGMTADE